MKLQGKIAVVTGAASGMGQAIATVFAREGAGVVVSDINAERAEAVAAELEQGGATAIAVATNVSEEKDIQHLMDTAVAHYGTLDILVNNAGIMDNFVPAHNLTDELWEKVLAVNTTGVMRGTRKALNIFLEKKAGVIINIASIGGLRGSRAGAAYTASKHAVVGLTRNVAFQYADSGIRCNAIAPGAVETNIADTIDNPDSLGMEKATAGHNLNPRIADAEEIARVALFLASDDASIINGAVITADAGWTAY